VTYSPGFSANRFAPLTLSAPKAHFDGFTLIFPPGHQFVNTTITDYWFEGSFVSIEYVCRPCSGNTYSLIGASVINNEDVIQCNCSECPEFAICPVADEVLSWPGVWCHISDSRLSLLTCSPCPRGYCKSEAGTMWNETCTDNRQGILCGECKEGYSAEFGTEDCVEDSACTAAAWFFPAVIIISMCILGIIVWMPINHLPLWKSTMFFLKPFSAQMSCLAISTSRRLGR